MRQVAPNIRGLSLAAAFGAIQQAAFRQPLGVSVLWLGVTLAATMDSVDPGEGDYIPDGSRPTADGLVGQNAANADGRVFTFNFADFAAASVSPIGEGAEIDITAVASGAAWPLAESYRVTKASLNEIGTTWRCVAYRAPEAGQSIGDAAQEAAWTL
jgi:hypothetical protein